MLREEQVSPGWIAKRQWGNVASMWNEAKLSKILVTLSIERGLIYAWSLDSKS